MPDRYWRVPIIHEFRADVIVKASDPEAARRMARDPEEWEEYIINQPDWGQRAANDGPPELVTKESES